MITISGIIAVVAAYHGIRPEDVTGHRRDRVYAWPRQEAYWIARRITGRSLPEIAMAFGDRDHTTILHGIRAFERRTDWARLERLTFLFSAGRSGSGRGA